MSFFNKKKTINVSPCNVYSSKLTELTGYDAAYTKELSGVRQQQSQVTTKLSDADSKIKSNTDTIASLNQKKPQLEAQLAPLEKQRTDAESAKNKLLKDRAPADTAKANLEKQKPGLEKSITDLKNKLAGEVRAANTGNIFKRMAAKMRLAKTTAVINNQINAQAKSINNINTQINAQTKIINDINTKIAAQTKTITDINTKIKSINDQLQPISKQLTELNTSQTTLKTTRDGNNLLKTQLTKTESDTNTKMARNKEDLVKVLKDKAECENKGSACGIAKKQIEDQKKLLKQYEAELAGLNKQSATCNGEYEKKCSVSQRNSLTKIIADRATSQTLLDNNQTEYKKNCEGKMANCGSLNSIFKQKLATYDFENSKKTELYSEYKTCMDQTKNDCKDKHSNANFNKSMTNMNINMIKPSTNKSKEGFTQYTSNDNADATHAKLLGNYNSVKRDYAKLAQNIQELNNANNNDTSKTSKYATKKQLYDNAVYTNILLTALATSMLYYVFVDI